ncbi:hypothetical protein EJ02DRAFT_62779 [Clathrospora elynae]|uniref:Uncharacterized protein n=1 Tax=Clathrospora elynae TaxID=706981 RepID=A0A6A5S9B3_9PLEO|nr:hypothetical protein EJ02DRAFT_62779 [Clathrospora elynae]
MCQAGDFPYRRFRDLPTNFENCEGIGVVIRSANCIIEGLMLARPLRLRFATTTTSPSIATCPMFAHRNMAQIWFSIIRRVPTHRSKSCDSRQTYSPMVLERLIVIDLLLQGIVLLRMQTGHTQSAWVDMRDATRPIIVNLQIYKIDVWSCRFPRISRYQHLYTRDCLT